MTDYAIFEDMTLVGVWNKELPDSELYSHLRSTKVSPEVAQRLKARLMQPDELEQLTIQTLRNPRRVVLN